MNKPSVCTLYLVRHGQTDWNKVHKITGQSDIPLNDEGKLQAKELSKSLQDVHFDAIFSSDLIRAKQTAEILAAERQLAIETSHLMRERNFGSIEGHATDELRALIDSYRKLSDKEINAHKIDEAYESNDELIGRVITFLREVSVAYMGKKVLIVTHGSVLRTLLIHLGYATLQDAPFRIIRNVGYAKLESDGVDFSIAEINPGAVML